MTEQRAQTERERQRIARFWRERGERLERERLADAPLEEEAP